MNVTSVGSRQGIAQNFALGLFPVVKEAASNLGGRVSAQFFALFFCIGLIS